MGKTPSELLTYRNGDMANKCSSCNKRGGRHRLGCPEFKQKRFHQPDPEPVIIKDGGDPLPITFHQ